MQAMSRRMAWKIVGSLSGVLAGLAARRVLLLTWRFFRDSDPPANPASRRTTWAEAVAWSVASVWPSAWPGLIAQRGAAEAWRRPPGPTRRTWSRSRRRRRPGRWRTSPVLPVGRRVQAANSSRMPSGSWK